MAPHVWEEGMTSSKDLADAIEADLKKLTEDSALEQFSIINLRQIDSNKLPAFFSSIVIRRED